VTENRWGFEGARAKPQARSVEGSMLHVSKSSGEHDHKAKQLWMRKLQQNTQKEGVAREKSPLSVEIWIQNPRSELHYGELVHK